jgi:ribA/ribD-fused uncharacterized protein
MNWMFYQRFTILMMMTKLFMSASDFTTMLPDDTLPPVQVFYLSAFHANVLGKSRPVWLFKGVSYGLKLNNKCRLLTVLRLLLLLAAGDIESNPGPTPDNDTIESFPNDVPVPDGTIHTSYPCAKCGENCDDDCIQCEYCMRWEHNHCSNLTRSMCLQVAKYQNLIYLCNECQAAGIMSILRRIFYKLSQRNVTLGKLLDVYDALISCNSTKTDIHTQTSHENTDAIIQTGHDQNSTASTDEPDPEQPVLEVPAASGPNEKTVTIDNVHLNDSAISELEPEPIIVKGRQDPRSNFYQFSFTYKGVKYKSLEHAYQSLKALMCGAGFGGLAWQIRQASSPQAAKKIADGLPRVATKKLHDLMFDLLKSKLSQSYSFRRSLRATGSRKIFHSTYKDVDLYWCTGLDHRDIEGHRGEYAGLNVFGQMLEAIRDDHLLDEVNYETRTTYLEAEHFVILLYDGEENIYPWNYGQDFYRRGSGYHRYRH